jgi:O-antigen/teichoic acid export membrane protein
MAKIDLKELKKGTGFLFFGQMTQAAVGFGANLVLVRFLFPEEFGHFALIMAGATLVFAMVALRIDAMIIRTPDGKLTELAQDRYFAAAVYETAIATVLLFVWLIANEGADWWEYGLVLALGGRHWAQQNKGFYERGLPYRKLAVTESVVAITSHFFAVGMVLSGFGAEVLFLREFYLTVFGLIGFWWIGGLTFRRFKVLNFGDIRALLFEAKGLWLDSVLEQCFSRIVILLVGEVGGERSAGFFFQAQKLAVIPQQLIAPAVGRVASNWFARVDDLGSRRKGRNRLLLFVSAVLFVFSGMCLLFGETVVPLLFGDNWSRSGTLLSWMSGMIMFLTLFELLRYYCLAVKLVRWLLVARCLQYVGGAIPVAVYMFGWMEGDLAMALALSSAYAMAFICLSVILLKSEK